MNNLRNNNVGLLCIVHFVTTILVSANSRSLRSITTAEEAETGTKLEMDSRNRDSITESHTSSSSSDSLSEAWLFTTMCIVGLPVNVHVKDGSVYSGIFHTASVHAD